MSVQLNALISFKALPVRPTTPQFFCGCFFVLDKILEHTVVMQLFQTLRSERALTEATPSGGHKISNMIQ